MKRIFPRMNTVPLSSIIPAEPPGTRIPKIFHQTYMDKNLPPALAENRANIIAMNPGWECRLYDDHDIATFIRGQYGAAVLAQFERISPEYGAARADFFRYLLMYKVGGVYLDVKSAPTRPFDELIRDDDRFLLSYWNNKQGDEHEGYGLHADFGPEGELQQWMIIAAPGHPYMKAVIDAVLHNIANYLPGLHGVGRFGVFALTGPITYTHAINRIIQLHPHRFVSSERDLGIKYSIMAKLQHRELFRNNHYSQKTSPIIRLSAEKKLADIALRALRKLKRLLKPRPRPAQA
jgi:mannosyltransferase OCH1-like enzyme